MMKIAKTIFLKEHISTAHVTLNVSHNEYGNANSSIPGPDVSSNTLNDESIVDVDTRTDDTTY